MTYTLTVQIEIETDQPTRTKLASAVCRALTHACTSDIAGAELLDSRIGQITVTPVRQIPRHKRP